MKKNDKFKVDELPLTKLFWGKYPYAITFTNPKGKGSWRRTIDHRSSKIPSMLSTNFGSLIDSMPTDVTTYRLVKPSYGNWVFYCTTEAAQAAVLSTFTSIDEEYRVISVVRPSTETDVAELMSDEKAIVRSDYFYKHFSWKVKISTKSGVPAYDSADDVILWAKSTLMGDSNSDRLKITRGYYDTNCILYLKHEDDVLMAKLTYGHQIETIVRVILATPATPPNNNNNKGNNDASCTIPTST